MYQEYLRFIEIENEMSNINQDVIGVSKKKGRKPLTISEMKIRQYPTTTIVKSSVNQAYALTLSRTDEKVEEFYDEILMA